MKTVDAIKTLQDLANKGHYLLTPTDLRIAFKENGNTFQATIKRLRFEGILSHPARSIYCYELADFTGRDVMRDAVCVLRPGEYMYESLESAASMWSVISQIPIGHVMVITSGPSSTHRFAGGIIEFVHVELNALDFANCKTVDREPHCALPLATKEQCVRDLMELKRSVDLIDWEEVEDNEQD